MKNCIISIFYILLITTGCKEAGIAVKTESSKIKLTTKDLNTEEAVVNFVNENRMRKVSEVKTMLWEPKGEYVDDGILYLWYTIDDLPFTELKNDENKLLFGGFTLKFKDNKLLKADYDYR